MRDAFIFFNNKTATQIRVIKHRRGSVEKQFSEEEKVTRLSKCTSFIFLFGIIMMFIADSKIKKWRGCVGGSLTFNPRTLALLH